jgi:hypothetical protein
MPQSSSRGSRSRERRGGTPRRTPPALLAGLLITATLAVPAAPVGATGRVADPGTWTHARSAPATRLSFARASTDPLAGRSKLGPAPRLAPGQRPSNPRTALRPASGIVDTADRSAVATAYLTRYLPQFSVTAGWTGSIAECRPGTVADGYAAATRETVNYFRNLAGLPDVTFAPSLDSPSQAAALIMQASGTLTHAPTSDMPCYSESGHAGASHSNLCLGCVGPGAIAAYMQDGGSGNTAAGHRRWILYPPQTTLGAGSTSGANALYVLDWGSWVTPADAPAWVTWPPAGYVPYQHVYPRFTLSRPGADFGSATARVTLDGVELPSQVVARNGGYGDPAIVIEIDLGGLVLDGQDRTFEVTVEGISVGGATVSHAWESISFDPSATSIAITPGSGGFGPVTVGTTSPAQRFEVRNSGAIDLHVGALRLAGSDPGEFDMASDECSARVLAPGATCAAKVVFVPSTSGDRSAVLVVPSDADAGPDHVSLSGRGSPGPAGPVNVTATGTSATQVRITWADVVGETGYRVRRQVGSEWPVARSVGADALAATDGGRTPGTRYTYKVCAYDATGERCSGPVVGWTRPAAPGGLVATAANASAIRLTWADVAGEKGYRIRRQDGTAWGVVVDGLAPDTDLHVDRGLAPFTAYRYRACAYNVSGETCAVTSATTLPATVVVDDRSTGFTRTGSGWQGSSAGLRAHSWWAPVRAESVTRTGTWQATLAAAGRYRVDVYLPPGQSASRNARYLVRTVDGDRVAVIVDQAVDQGTWVSLGRFDLPTAGWVRLTDRTGEATGSGVLVGFDAVRFVPVALTTSSLAPGSSTPTTKPGAGDPAPSRAAESQIADRTDPKPQAGR